MIAAQPLQVTSLQGQRIVVTRARHQADEFAQALTERGAQAFFFPTIQIEPVAETSRLDLALAQLPSYAWLVLTSRNAVEIVCQRLETLGYPLQPGQPHVAAVGPQTAASLQAYGITPDFVPEAYLAEAILPGLGELSGRCILLPTAQLAPETLPKAIQAADGVAHVITIYDTLPTEQDAAGLQAIQAGVDWITFTSGSTARNFYELMLSNGLDPLHLPGDPHLACIGPKTALVAQNLGFENLLIAEEYTVAGLIAAIEQYTHRSQ